jgi:hypothetical protein
MTKVDVPKFNIAIIWTPIFEWYVIRCGAKNEHQNTMYLKEIGLDAQNMLTLGFIHDKMQGAYTAVMSTRIFTLTMNKIFI